MGERRIYAMVPKAGRGLFTAWSPLAMDDFQDAWFSFTDIIVEDHCWKARFRDTLTTLTASTAPIWAIHFFNSIDTMTPSATTQTTALIHSGGTTAGGGTATVHRNDSSVITVNGVPLATINPHELFFLTIKNRCFVAGVNLTGGAIPTVITKFPTETSYPWGVHGPLGELTYTPYTNPPSGTSNAGTKVFFKSASISNTAGSTTFTGSSFVTDGSWIGKTLIVDNAPSLPYTISTVSSATTLITVTNGTGYVSKDYRVQYGNISWTTEPPKYAYAYYNPATGHISNISPILRLSEQDMSNVGVELTNILRTGDPVYTRIVLFRTATDGGELFPLKLNALHGGTATIVDGMINNTTAGTVTYRDNEADSQLGLVLGLIPAPLRNLPPPTDMRYLNYWDGRVWFSTISAPFRLRYSRITAPNELGVGEESFPQDHFIDIPSDDGIITGIRSVGTGNLICTDKFLYFVEGSSETDYRLVRLSARGSGVNHYAIDEHPGDSSTEAASAVYISRDKKLWRHHPGGQLEDLGAPIQDKLDLATMSHRRPFQVRVFNVGKQWLMAVGIINSALTSYDTFFYDFENRLWYDFGYGTFGTLGVWSYGAGINFSGSVAGTFILGTAATSPGLFALSADILTSATPTGFTHPHDMGDRKGKKSLEDIIFYINNDTLVGWNCEVRLDGDLGIPVALTQAASVVSSPRYAGANIIHWSPLNLGPKQWHALQLKVTLGGASTALQGKLYRIEIIYRVESTGASGLP